jgi:hypothetical protein
MKEQGKTFEQQHWFRKLLCWLFHKPTDKGTLFTDIGNGQAVNQYECGCGKRFMAHSPKAVFRVVNNKT